MNDSLSAFESIKKFNRECDVDINKLIGFSKKQDDIQLFISSAIVLLGAKFESCIESLIEEYVNKINSKSNKGSIPDELKYSSIYNKFCKYKERINKNHFDCFSTESNFLDDFSSFVITIMDNSNALEINNKFDYGKHGYKELVKLFKNIAINIEEDKFNKFPKAGLFQGIIQEISFKDEFNKFTNNRNIVIHQNECPNITDDDVLGIVDIFKQFIEKIGIEINDRLQNMN